MKPEFLPTSVEDVSAVPFPAANLTAASLLASSARRLQVWALGTAAVLAALALPELADPVAAAGPGLVAAQGWTHAGFIVLSALLVASKVGALLQRSGAGDGQEAGSPLLDMAGLAAYGNRLQTDSLRTGKSVSVAVFDFPDLLEVRAIYGNAVFAKLRRQVLDALVAMAGRRGVAAQMGPARFAVILPGLGRERTLATIARVLGSPSRIEYDGAHSEIVLVPEFLIETVAAQAASVPTVCRGLAAEIDRMNELQARRAHHMQRERERHSRPHSLPTQEVSLRRRPRALPVPMAHPLPLLQAASA